MLSTEGTMYMPKGQCSLYRKEAYSRETAVRVRGETLASGVVIFAWEALRLGGGLGLGPEMPRSIVGEVTSDASICVSRASAKR
jgi:hypothetical protein